MSDDKTYCIRVPFPDEDKYVYLTNKDGTLLEGQLRTFRKFDDAFNYGRDHFENFDVIEL